MLKFAAVLLMTLGAVIAQSSTASNSGHYQGGASPLSRWGANSKTFTVREGMRNAGMRNEEATFTVSEEGLAWAHLQLGGWTFVPWQDLTGWCRQDEASLRVTSRQGPASVDIWALTPADVAMVVEKYLKRYAPSAEKSDGDGCTIPKPPFAR